MTLLSTLNARFDNLEIDALLHIYVAAQMGVEKGVSQLTGVIVGFGMMSAASVDGERHFYWRHWFIVTAVVALFVGPGAAVWLPYVIDYLEDSGRWPTGTFRDGIDLPWVEWIAGALVGLSLWWGIFHYALEWIATLRAKLTRRTSTARQGRTDIRTVHELLPKPGQNYAPEKFFKPGKIFVGLDQFGRQVWISYDIFRRCHVQLVGTTGSGKGVVAGLLIAQALTAGESVAVIDPKDDEWAPHLCRQSAERAGRRFVLFDLRLEEPQFNLIDGATAEQVEELLVAGMGLSDRGDAADHYRVKDRKAARHLARYVLARNPNVTLADLSEAAGANNEIQKNAEGFAGRLAEIASPAVCAKNGPSLAKMIAEGACIYFVGSMRHGRILCMQRMLLVRLCQLVESRDRLNSPPRQLLIFLDELKAHVSKPALEMLGTIRDKGAHLILAHQSLGDLRDCPNDLNPDAVADAVIENCKIRIAYKVQNADTAEWLARTTGKILVDDESRNIDRMAFAETATGARTIRQGERPLVDENMLLGLPERVAVVFSPAGVEFAHVSPIEVDKRPIRPNVADMDSPGGKDGDNDPTAGMPDDVDL